MHLFMAKDQLSYVESLLKKLNSFAKDLCIKFKEQRKENKKERIKERQSKNQEILQEIESLQRQA